MIFFVHHYLHRGKVHTISVKTTNTLSHRRHQQGQRRASHQSVCPFFVRFSFFYVYFARLLLLYTGSVLPFWWSFVCFCIASPIFILYFSHFSFSMWPNRDFAFRFYCPPPILCLLFTEDMRVVQTDQRSVHHRSPHIRHSAPEKNTNKVIYIQILCGFLRFFKSSEYRSQTSQRTNTQHTEYINAIYIFVSVLAHSRTRVDCIRYTKHSSLAMVLSDTQPSWTNKSFKLIWIYLTTLCCCYCCCCSFIFIYDFLCAPSSFAFLATSASAL